MEGGTDNLWISDSSYGRAAFDLDTKGNLTLGVVAHGVPTTTFSAAEDVVVLANYGSDGSPRRIRTLCDLGISYIPSFRTLLNHMGPVYRLFANNYVPYPMSVHCDRSGNTYVRCRKRKTTDLSMNALTVGDTTFYAWAEAHQRVQTRFGTQGLLRWARNLEHDYNMFATGVEVTDDGHIYVWGNFRGGYLTFEDIELRQNASREYNGFVVHCNENSHLLRALHLQAAGNGLHSIGSLAIGPSGEVYVAGRFASVWRQVS